MIPDMLDSIEIYSICPPSALSVHLHTNASYSDITDTALRCFCYKVLPLYTELSNTLNSIRKFFHWVSQVVVIITPIFKALRKSYVLNKNVHRGQ